ncbi:hypothetical protein MNBD_ALPHA04-2241 [hydrothermal vent metagenome]|uniref:Lipoprotein n=1 Tax=hydrothermal vent metagenome TaxID=652676 RepID=A0A3B0RI86_9ZZZZ
MRKRYFAAFAVLPLLLTACTSSDDTDSDGIEVSIDLSDEETPDTEKIKIGDGEESGKFSIKADGFALDVDLPSIKLDSGDFDMNNVNLYPGSKVTGLNIEDKDGKGGKVRLSFTAPLGVEKLTDWYETKMKEEDFSVIKNETGLSGKTDEGDAFSLQLTGKSADETVGQLEFYES